MAKILIQAGYYFDLSDPKNNRFDIQPIAHSLSNLCRFTGHTKKFYSVAQHSYNVAMLVPDEYKLSALMHDAAEAYIGDVSAPLKSILPDYRRVEEQIRSAIYGWLDLPIELPECVIEADMIMLATERRDLMGEQDEQWPCLENISPRKEPITYLWGPGQCGPFMSMFRDLAQSNFIAGVAHDYFN